MHNKFSAYDKKCMDMFPLRIPLSHAADRKKKKNIYTQLCMSVDNKIRLQRWHDDVNIWVL